VSGGESAAPVPGAVEGGREPKASGGHLRRPACSTGVGTRRSKISSRALRRSRPPMCFPSNPAIQVGHRRWKVCVVRCAET